jgi:hypothetical protein
MNKIDTFLTKALDKLFQSVGFEKFDSRFSNQDGWYSMKTWTEDQSDEFKNWFIKEYVKTFKYKKPAEREYQWFNLMWGWKIDDKK